MSMVVLPLLLVVDGNVLVGAKLYAYDAGTTRPRTSYTTPANSVAYPNPMVSTASGPFPTVHVNPAGGNQHRPSAMTGMD